MAYTALQLITNSFFLSQVISKQLQTLSGEQANDGLQLLQDLINFKSTDLRLIPYFTEYNSTFIQGQEMYFIPNLLAIDTFTFTIGGNDAVRYSMSETTRFRYFEQYRINNVQSLPYQYRVERQLGGANVYVYFVPDQAYPIQIWGKFALPAITSLTQNLQLTYDNFYIEFLRYALAEYICSLYSATLPDLTAAKLKELTKKLMEVSPSDLSVNRRSYFSGYPGIDWAQINIGKGYTPF